MHRRTLTFLSRPLVEKFWSPFKKRIVGADIGQYAFQDVIAQIVTPDNFTCQINGAVGDARLLEDFFIVVLSGFDIVTPTVTELVTEPTCVARGHVSIRHSRPFLGWQPTDSELLLPFTMRVESCCHANRASHITLKVPLAEALRSAGCPEEVAHCTANPDAMKMLVTLRRARVRPEIISHRAIASATKRPAMWSSALGLM